MSSMCEILVHAYILSTGEDRQEEGEFQTCLGYKVLWKSRKILGNGKVLGSLTETSSSLSSKVGWDVGRGEGRVRPGIIS